MKKTKVLSLTTLLLALGLAGCGEKEAPKVDPCEKHTWGEYEVTKEATCKEAGSKKRVCTVCATEDVKEIAKKTTHSYTTTSETDATCQAAGSKVETCSVCNDVKTTPLAKLDHQYVTATDSTHTATTATCTVKGSHWEKCSKCNDWKKVEEGFAAHAWGAETTVSAASPKVTKSECSSCHQVKISIEAVSGTITGTNKKAGDDNLDGYLKLSNKNEKAAYEFSMDKALTGKVYFEGRMDHWSSNSSVTFYSGKNGGSSLVLDCGKANFDLKVNSTTVDCSANKDVKVSDVVGTEEDPDHSSFSKLGLFEVGTGNLVSGTNTVSFERLDSYNLLIKNFVFIGTLAA